MELWKPFPDRIADSNAAKFIETLERRVPGTVKGGDPVAVWESLYRWSIAESDAFWEQVAEFTGVRFMTRGSETVRRAERFRDTRWFPDSTLNYAANLLRYDDDRPALVFWGEERVRLTYTFRELRERVAKLAAFLRRNGVGAGDRVAGFVPNHPDTIAAMLAASAVGAVWSSCSPDFGVAGAVDRFGQIEPKVLFTADGYLYRGVEHDSLEKVRAIRAEVPSISTVAVIGYLDESPSIGTIEGAVSVRSIVESPGNEPLDFAELPFNHPLFIMYSSGTTGKPKCIMHGAGGTLLEHLKELVLHVDLKRDDRIFYQTTCGWMMWNWLVTSLAAGATLVLYDGYPFARDGKILFDLADETGITVFGTNAKFIASLEKEGVRPKESHRLDELRTILSTGSPLLPEGFEYVYRDIKEDVCLSSISGGTDILGCFALGSPFLPVHRGELQCRTLGYDVQVWNDRGQPIVGEKGELVCAAPFPSMPVGFWNDADHAKFDRAYFERFEGVWHHGDYVELTPRGGMIFYGRSDAVLNPGGIRIGTAEIYRQVEQLPEIAESIVIGQNWKGDVRVVLFVKPAPGVSLTLELEARIRTSIRANTTPFHVPKKIVAVPDIPRTRSGKIVELAVRDAVEGKQATNLEALLNPEALEYFRGVPDLNTD